MPRQNQLSLFDDHNKTIVDKVSDFIQSSQSDNKDDFNEDNFYVDNDSSSITQINRISTDYLFGSYGKLNRIKDSNLMRGRESKGFKVVPLKDLLEDFTYFFLDLTSLKLVIIKNSKIHNIKKGFPNFLMNHFRLTSLYEKIELVNLLSDEITNSLGAKHQVTKIKYSYQPDKLPDNEFVTFREISEIETKQIKTATVSIEFKTNTIIDGIRESLDRFKDHKDKFKEMKLDNDQETINFMENQVSKKAFLELKEDQLEDEDYIFNQLKKFIENA